VPVLACALLHACVNVREGVGAHIHACVLSAHTCEYVFESARMYECVCEFVDDRVKRCTRINNVIYIF
jgi:hypothetical protein